MVTSASLLGAVVGSAIAIFLRDKIGRKFELLLSAGCYGMSCSASRLMYTHGVPFGIVCIADTWLEGRRACPGLLIKRQDHHMEVY